MYSTIYGVYYKFIKYIVNVFLCKPLFLIFRRDLGRTLISFYIMQIDSIVRAYVTPFIKYRLVIS